MNAFVATLGALPALVAMAYVDKLDAKRPEPPSLLRRVALAGALSGLPAGLIEYAANGALLRSGAFGSSLLERGMIIAVTAALVEELAKALCLLAIIWRRPEFDERFDGIVYGTRAALGFALVENVLYLLTDASTTALVGMYIVRALLTVPMHGIAGAMMGYFASRRRFDARGPGIVGGFAIAAAFHGVFDASIFGALAAGAAGWVGLAALLLVVPVALVALGLLVVRRMARAALARDELAFDRERTSGNADTGR